MQTIGTLKLNPLFPKIVKVFFLAAPPTRIVIRNEAGMEVSGMIGPYPLAGVLRLTCQVDGGELYFYILQKLFKGFCFYNVQSWLFIAW